MTNYTTVPDLALTADRPRHLVTAVRGAWSVPALERFSAAPVEPALSRRTSRLLYIASALPVPPKIGPSRRNYHILEQLARFYDVSVLALGSQQDAATFRAVFGSRVSAVHFVTARRNSLRKIAWKVFRTALGRCDFCAAYDPDLRDLCTRVAHRGSFDAIVLSNALLHTLPLPPSVPLIGDTHNVEFDLLLRMATTSKSFVRRMYSRRQAPVTRDEERRAAHRVDVLLATSERDRDVFEGDLDASDVEVVSNGIDLDEFRPASRPGDPGVILFTGLMSYYPNQQAIRWFLDHVFPLILRQVPDAKLVVAGASPPRWLVERADSRVHVTGAVPDMRPILSEARLTIAPLLSGGGTRVKILESQAVGRPVVSTTVGAEGLGVRHGESILLADDPVAFAVHCVAMLSDDKLAASVVNAARRYVISNHDWHCIGERLARVLSNRVGLTPRECTPALEPTAGNR